MKRITTLQTGFCSIVFACMPPTMAVAQIANNWANDIGIENDPMVVFTEMFEQNDVPTLLGPNNSNYMPSSLLQNITFGSSVPAGSLGQQSLKLTTVETTNVVTNDPHEDSYILKRFSTGIFDSVYVRYYVKYNSQFTFHHSGVSLGGTNPNYTCWPCNPANTLASGDSAFRVGSEVRGAVSQAQTNTKFGFFNYWMGQHPNNAGVYLANEFYNSGTADIIDMNAWNCIEVRLKLNEPVSESNGELTLWVNGVLVSQHGYHFPDGTWNETHFTEGTGAPFEGFRWRSNPALGFNYLWIKNYSTYNTNAAPNDVLYDHIVVAKSYIGPISTLTTGLQSNPTKPSIVLYPDPTNSTLNFSQMLSQVEVTDLYGKQIFMHSGPISNLDCSQLANGIYLLRSALGVQRFVVAK